MFCLADRFFPSHKLWRSRQNARLEVDHRLPDGSCLSVFELRAEWRSPAEASSDTE
jgi:hypothetical protein